MCKSIEYQGRRIEFLAREAQLPVLARSGAVHWLRWGLQPREEHLVLYQAAGISWQALDGPQWAPLRPRPVVIPANRYGLYDRDDEETVWLDVPDGAALRGALIVAGSTARVYLVLDQVCGLYGQLSSWWPRLIELPTRRTGNRPNLTRNLPDGWAPRRR